MKWLINKRREKKERKIAEAEELKRQVKERNEKEYEEYKKESFDKFINNIKEKIKRREKEIQEYEKQDEGLLKSISDEINEKSKNWLHPTPMNEVELEALKQEWMAITTAKKKRIRKIEEEIQRFENILKDPDEEFENYFKNRHDVRTNWYWFVEK